MIAQQHGLPTTPVEELTASGSVNHVYVIGNHDDRHVIRFATDPRRENEFTAEAWCSRAASQRGVATAECVAVGEIEQVPFAIHRYVVHVDPAGLERTALWRTLGQHARRLAGCAVDDAPATLFSRFGRDLAAAWQAHLGYNLSQLTQKDQLAAMGVYAST